MQILLYMLCICILCGLFIGTRTNNNSSMVRNYRHIGKLSIIRQDFE